MREANGFIDIHTHILPGIDDGSDSMEESIRMLRLAYEQGIRTIIATPHYIPGAHNVPVEHLGMVRERVQEEASKISPDLQILLGNEIYYSGSAIGLLKSKEALTLADSRYALFEFSPRESYDTIYKGLSEVIRAGYMPILAHVERYYCFRKKEYRINELIELGCYIQMNCSSVLGGMLDTEASYNRKLVNQGFVHLLGSDCHDDKVRVPCMKAIEKTLLKKCDESLVHKMLYVNPFKVLENTYI